MSHPLDLSIIRVYDQSNRVIGASFLIDAIHAVTCAHVIQDALGISGKVDLASELTVKIDFPLLLQQKISYARVTFLDRTADIAGLELTGDPPPGAQPVRIVVSEDDLWDHDFRTFGFSLVGGAWASGTFRGKNADGWLQIEDTKSTGYGIQPGFSGAPVWDEELQAVVGMIVAADKNTGIKAAFCIPGDMLARWDKLKNKIKPSHQETKLFFSYKRDAQPDRKVVDFLVEYFTSRGYAIFTDTTIRMGEKWLDQIDEELKASEFLVVFLSEISADSEMVQSEIHRAYEHRRLNGYPRVLPIRVAYDEMLPYSISAFLNPLQYIIWNNEADNERVAKELTEAIQGQLPAKAPHGRVKMIGDEKIPKPLPAFDASILDGLTEPGGTVKLQDKFYIERSEDRKLKIEMNRKGTTVTIRAARQTGKSSLLIRGIQQAKQAGANTIVFDMQRVDKDHLTSLDIFLRYFADYIVTKLMLDSDVIDHYWRKSLGPQEKLTSLFEDLIFDKVDRNLVLGMDEIDRLLQTSFANEFFGLIRSWHNLRATDETWDKLSTIMVISTEPYLLISDYHQSPFNVGANLYLQDFNTEQIQDLNIRHGTPVSGVEFNELVQIFGGHPFLTRRAFYLLVADGRSWKDLKATAAEEHGPFGDHLRRYHWMIQQDPELKDALKNVIKNNKCSDQMLHRLLQAGLVKASGDIAKCRCGLYLSYFEDKL